MAFTVIVPMVGWDHDGLSVFRFRVVVDGCGCFNDSIGNSSAEIRGTRGKVSRLRDRTQEGPFASLLGDQMPQSWKNGRPEGHENLEKSVCLKMLCSPLYPMVLLIIIPFLYMAISLGILTQHFQTTPNYKFECLV